MQAVSAPLSVLVVDDDEAIREAVQWMLEEAGFSVICMPGGMEALAFLRAHGIADVMLSDINMPAMDGVQLSRLARQLRPSLPVLLTSGQQPPPGTPAFLPKPFRWEALTSAIQTLLGPPIPA